MSGDTRTTTAAVLDRWATHLSELRLRVERDEDDPDDEPYEVLIGRRDYQGIELELAPGREWGSREDSQSCERFRQGAVEFTTAWDDGWTEVPKPEGYGYLDWVEESLRQMVACHLRWGVETALDPRGCTDGTLQLARELLQVQQFGGADFKLTEVVTDLMAVADAWVRASTGDEAATHTLAQAAAASPAGLDEKESTLSLLVAGARDLPDAQQDAFAAALRPRLEAETRRVGEAAESNPRGFIALKAVADVAPPAINHMIGGWLQELAAAQMPASADARALLDKINRYNELHNDWRTYQPSAEDPMSVGAAFMRLEAEIAEAWRAEFAQETGLVRSELARRRTSEGRFLSGASACVLGWLRAQGHYDMAVEEFCAQVADTELVRLRHRSQVYSFELLVNNALGAFLDSGNPAHIERGVQCLDALEAVIEWQTNSALYQIACVYARAGLTDRAITMIERAVEGGRSIETMASDSDFASVVDDPRFQRLRDSVAGASDNSR